MVVVASLLDVGLVDNAAHPGGNITGVSPTGSPDEEGKNLGFLGQCVPGAKSVVYYTSGVGGMPTPGTITELGERASAAAAAKLGLSFTYVVGENTSINEAEYRRAFAAGLSMRPDMIQFGRGTAVSAATELLAKLALDARMPTIAPYSAFAPAGGLISYGSNSIDYYRKAAGYVALILQGAKPGDLPVLQPTVFDFIVNLKTAKALGLTLPPSILAQATQVIE
jgi:putative ABC transport system substrate-binding protein